MRLSKTTGSLPPSMEISLIASRELVRKLKRFLWKEALFQKLHICHMYHIDEKSSTFKLFLQANVQQIKTISQIIMSLFIIFKPPFDYFATDRLNK